MRRFGERRQEARLHVPRNSLFTDRPGRHRRCFLARTDEACRTRQKERVWLGATFPSLRGVRLWIVCDIRVDFCSSELFIKQRSCKLSSVSWPQVPDVWENARHTCVLTEQGGFSSRSLRTSLCGNSHLTKIIVLRDIPGPTTCQTNIANKTFTQPPRRACFSEVYV